MRPLVSYAISPAFRLHLVISLLAYSLFTIARLQVLMMAAAGAATCTAANCLRILQSLPPLLTMERLLFRIIAAGFVLLTLTLGSGMLFSEELFGNPLKFTHKIVFGIAAWCIFAALLAGRRFTGGAAAWRYAGPWRDS